MAPGPRLLWLAGVPLAWALVLCFHPVGETDVYTGISENLTAWLFVHIATMVFIPLVAISVLVLLQGVPGLAARISRFALLPFAAFYLAWEAVTGIASGVLVDEGGGRQLVNDFYKNPIAGDPSVINVLGSVGWIVATVAAGIAIRKAGAPLVAAILVALGAIASAHPFPTGPIFLTCFAVGAVLYERSARSPAAAPVAQP